MTGFKWTGVEGVVDLVIGETLNPGFIGTCVDVPQGQPPPLRLSQKWKRNPWPRESNDRDK